MKHKTETKSLKRKTTINKKTEHNHELKKKNLKPFFLQAKVNFFFCSSSTQ